MFTKKSTLTGAAVLSLVAVFGLTACSGGSTTTEDTDAGTTASESAEPSTAPEETMESDDTMDPAANLVGAGCADYAEAVPDGAGSIDGMALDPVAVAASNNPLLTTLVAAVSGQLNPDVDLVDTLNGDEFTVFAPVDDAFAKIDQATIDTLSTDADLLTSILTYHVVPGQIAPDDIDGTHTTVNGADVEVTGSGDDIMVNDATVICGGVQTANATVYLIDTVLMPPAE
ncbi:fasciclin domain-containing protein [Microbacterium sp. NPDC055683]